MVKDGSHDAWQLLEEQYLSPSLTDNRAPAYEVKFLLSEAQAANLETWAREQLHLDPHGDPDRDGAYQVTTLYCDTPDFDVLFKSQGYRRRKFRLRRYGDSADIFVERKTKTGSLVRKRRACVHHLELPFLASPVSVPDWAGNWFHRRIWFKNLGPSCGLSYQRTAFGTQSDDGRVRVTIDRHLRSQRTRHWKVPAFGKGQPILLGKAVVEFKYQDTLPVLLKEALEQFRLQPTTHSKYRSAMEAWGVKAIRPVEAVHA
jgi:hypothetical protein